MGFEVRGDSVAAGGEGRGVLEATHFPGLFTRSCQYDR